MPTVYESLLINGVMITPAFVSTGRVTKSASETPPKPFVVQFEMQRDDFAHIGGVRPLLFIHCDSEEAGAEIIRQVFDKKGEAVKFQLSMRSDSEMLKKIWDKLIEIQG